MYIELNHDEPLLQLYRNILNTTYDASGNIMGIYEVKPDMNSNRALFISDLPIYGSSRLGVIHSDTKLSYIDANNPGIPQICINIVLVRPIPFLLFRIL
jgi:hypothetical protein